MPKGSLTRMPNGAMIPAGSTATRDAVNAWRYDVRQAATDAMHGRSPFHTAMRLMVDIALPYPATTIRKKQHGWWPHIKKPDIDKLLRAVMDHLTGIVWVDDAQVISCIVTKRYAWDGRYGAHVVLDAYTEDDVRSIAERQALVATLLGDHD